MTELDDLDDAGSDYRCENEVSIPAATLLPALLAYYNTVAGEHITDDDVMDICRDYEHRVKELAAALRDGFGVAFEYERLLESTTASVATRSVIDEDPRLRHPLCPPS